MASILAMVLAFGKAGGAQLPPPVPPPNAGAQIGGGRGPNPMPGLERFVDSPTSGPNAPRFEVASVKRNQAGFGGTTGSFSQMLPSGQVRISNAPLGMIVRTAYGLRLTDQLVGGPAWIGTDGFDIDAKPATAVGLEQSRYMLRTLLADRFKLVVRKESREGPIYALVLARRDGTLGPQIKRPAGDCVMVLPGSARPAGAEPDPAKVGAWPPPGRPGRRCGIGPDLNAIKAGSVTMTTLITFLTPLLDRPVVDKTGLSGNFDFDLQYDGAGAMPLPGVGRGRGSGVAVSPDAPADPAKGPTILTALQEQLGIRLDSQRGAIDVLAIISADLPSEN